MKQITLQTSVFYAHTQKLLLVGVFVVLSALLILTTIVQPVQAATSDTINFQARLQSSSGALVPDGFYNVEFKLYNTETLGTALWTETYYDANGATAGSDARVRVANGYLTVNLGSQTAFPGTINWSEQHWLTMNIGGTTQTASPTWDGEMSPRLKLTAVPYAFSAGQLQQTTGANTSTLGFATQTAANSILLPDASGTICLQSSVACGFMTGTAADYIQNGTSPQTADFNITGSATAGSLLSSSLDTAAAGTLTIGGTNATSIVLGENTVMGAGTSLTITGGNTASRPASPTEGMVYFDTTTKQLLTYANGKWQSDSKTAAFIVAANNSTQAAKDGAQYVTDGTGDEAEINAAITALPAAGGTVYLSEGTYNLSGTILLNKANVTLAGSGRNSVIKRMYNSATVEGLLTISVSDVKVTEIQVDGNKASYTNTNNRGIQLTGGSSQIIESTWLLNSAGYNLRSDNYLTGQRGYFANNFITGAGFDGIFLDSSQGARIENNTVASNGTGGVRVHNGSGVVISENTIITNTGPGLYGGAENVVVSGNHIANNTGAGVEAGSKWTVTGNNISQNDSGVSVYQSNTNVTISSNTIGTNTTFGIKFDTSGSGTSALITANTIFDNGTYGIWLANTPNNAVVTGNRLVNNGGTGSSSGIYVGSSGVVTKVKISDNDITDTAGTGYAIHLSGPNISGAYISNNTYSGTGAASISDSGTSTIFANQIDASGKLINRATDGVQIQSASGINMFNIDSSDNRITVGVSDANATLFVLDTKNTTGDPAGVDGAMYYNSADGKYRCYQNGAWTDCIGAGGGAGINPIEQGGNTFGAAATIGTTDAYGVNIITNGSTVASLTSTGEATFQNSTDSANAFRIMNAAGTNALLTANTTDNSVVLGAATSLTITGGATRPASPTEGMVYFDTTTKQLLTYANGKWQADRSTATKIVAASNSSQAAKDAADYVADGTADQTEINAALTAAAGGKVYIAEGTYSINDEVAVPVNTTLIGSGNGSVIKLTDNYNADILSMVTLNSGTNLTKLKIDGNFPGQDSNVIINTPYIQIAVKIAGTGVRVDEVEIDDIITAGININGTSQSNIVITNNKIRSGNAIEINTSPDGFIIQNNILTATMSSQPGNGIDIAASAYNGTISGNTITGNGYGVKLSGAENIRVSENNISNMGGSTANNAIFLEGSLNNFITNNVISDTSATTTNYAIDISESFSSNNYLADNVLGGGTINDAGTGTIYASQLDENGKLINKATDGLQIQDAAGVNLLDADSTDSRITIGVADANTTLFVLDGSSAATDPATAPDGSMYYNTTMNEFRCRINGAWANCGGTSGGANFQQGGNTFGATATIGTTDAYGVNIITNGSTVASLTSTGAANFKNVSDSANAFRVQNASNVSVFNINTTDSQVLVGTADSNATLFVLDTKDTDGDPATGVDGAMYYNSFMDEFRCYIAGAWTGCGGSGGGGGGGASRMAILIPEYAGGTLQADGTSNAGVMNADFVSGLSLAEGYKHNYYQWTSSNTIAQDYNIIVNTQVPTEYVSGLSNLKIWAYSSSTTLATGTVQFTDVDGTTCYGGPVSFTPSVANTWEQKSVGAMTNCVFSGNDIVTITISVVAEDNEVIRVGEISYEYTN